MMRILHLAPLWYPVSRDAPGGIETYLTGLIAALSRLGIENTLIASGDSVTDAELVPAVARHLVGEMKAGVAGIYAYYEQHELMLTLERLHEFDVVHSHVGPGAYMLSGASGSGHKVLHTEHNPVYHDLEWFVGQHPAMWLSTVSEFQARKLRAHGASRCHVIHNGIDVSAFTFQPEAGDELLFIGRMEQEKGPDIAVQVARALDRRLVLAGPITDQDFFDRTIKPFLDDRIRYVGVVDHREKDRLFGAARCVLMPSRWDEGFGLVTIEAMACGTPVVALANGALPEIIESGVTGYVSSGCSKFPHLVTQAMNLDRRVVRERTVQQFTIDVAARRYRQLYSRIAKGMASCP